MQNFKIFIFLLALVFFGINLQAQQAKPSPEQQAGKVITYTNAIVDLCNDAFKRMKEYSPTWEKSDNYIERIKSGKYDKKFPLSSIFYVNRIGAGYYAAHEETSQKVGTFPEKSELAKLVVQAKTSVQLLDTACRRLDRYFTQSQFEKDNKTYDRYNKLRDSAVEAWQNSRMAWRTLASRTSEVGNNAEIIIMKKAKGAPFIIPMKSDISTLERIVSELYDLFDYETLPAENLTALKTHAATLKASMEKNKNLQGKNVALLHEHESDYAAFYKSAEECLNHLLELVDQLAKEKQDQNAIEEANKEMNNEYRSAIEFYNFLIEIIN